MTNALERFDDRHLERLRVRAGIIAKMSGLKEQIADQPDTAFAIALDLDQRGFEVTPGNVDMAYHWVAGKATYSAQFYIALAAMHGWTVRALKDTRELAVVRATKDGQEPVETHWDVEDAIESHRLDAWVEDWRTAERSGKRYAVTYVVRINGEPMTWYGDVRGPLPEPLPKWVQDQVNSGAVKKFDAWWNYRRDMMVKSAMKRACKFAIPHILLGAPENHELPTPYVRPELGFIDADAYEEDEVPPEVYDDLPEANAGEPGTERYDPDDPKRPF